MIAVSAGKLSRKKIFFAHQSVGANIVEGISEITADFSGDNVILKETSDPADFYKPVFAHTRIGKNTDAISKINAFRELITGKIGARLDLAFLKLCYVDITATSDYKAIFDTYREAVRHMLTVHPRLQIVHWTVPLTVSKVTWKTKVKKMLGKRLWECEDNITRFRLNSMIRNHYSGRQAVFDLARIEMGVLEGKQSVLRVSGEKIEFLYPGYTDDGGHLNGVARKVVAEQLLLFLASLQAT